MGTSPYEWKGLVWDEKTKNKQKQTKIYSHRWEVLFIFWHIPFSFCLPVYKVIFSRTVLKYYFDILLYILSYMLVKKVIVNGLSQKWMFGTIL